jgi:hypothetical protein
VSDHRIATLREANASRRRRRYRRRRLIAVLALVLVILAAASVSRAAAGLPRSTIAYWDRVARCEQPDGAGGARWNHPGPRYQGGLGFYWGTWDWWARELGLLRRYPDAGDAPRLVQIRVADYGRRVHRGYWGCA